MALGEELLKKLNEDKKPDFEKDMIKLPFFNLMLEVTRKCNLRCEHCMRGEPQNIDMSDEILEKVFEQTEQCFHLSLTGGEPFLAPQVIEKMVDIIIEKKLHLWRCTTVDNGTILNELGIRSVKALNRLGEYIYNSVWNEKTRNDPDEKSPISVSISNSIYHKNDIQKAIDFYKSYANEYVNIDDQGEWETGLKDKQGNVIKNKDMKGNGTNWIKKEGRAKNFDNAKYITDTYRVEFWISDDETKASVISGIQVCANGNVVFAEPLSFETMDNKNMGNILKEPISCMVYRWNWNEPLSHEEVIEYCNNMKMLENPKLIDRKRLECQLKNSYFDMKKLLFVEGHKDYPYMSKKDLGLCVTAKLAIMCCENWKDLDPDMTEEDIIEVILKYECVGELTQRFTKKDLEGIIINITNNHAKEVRKRRGFFGYLMYIAELATHNKKYYDKLEVNTYEK